MEKANIQVYSKSDLQYIKQIGDFIKKTRLAQKRTQQELADDAGVNRGTLVQIEKGNPVGLLTFIQLLRALKKLELLGHFEYREELSPLKMAALQEKKPSRVRNRNIPHKVVRPRSDW